MRPAIPDNFFSLVHEGDGFVFEQWQSALSLKQAFRIVGLDAVLLRHGITAARYNFDSLDADEAYLMVPKEWRAEYRPGNINHPWDDLGKPQPSRSYASGSQPFHKACLSLLYAIAWMEKRGFEVPTDFFDRVKIVPITWRLSLCDQGFFDSHVKDKPLHGLLQRAVPMKSEAHIDELFTDNRHFCRHNALALQQVLNAHGPRDDHQLYSGGGKQFNGGAQELNLLDIVWPGANAAEAGNRP